MSDPNYVTLRLDDGRSVDVFFTGTVQVYDKAHGAFEFKIPVAPSRREVVTFSTL